jgi:imidazoleglycerol-phosphate dehydratase
MKRSVDAVMPTSPSALDANSNNFCHVVQFRPPKSPISTGIGYLDHMLDQFYSHAQIGLELQIGRGGEDEEESYDRVAAGNGASASILNGHNRNASCNQVELLSYVGELVGGALRELLQRQNLSAGQVSTFACPLDEALTVCVLESSRNSGERGELVSYTLPPYGKFPSTGRSFIGKLETSAIESFWEAVALNSGLNIFLDKVRGDNAHHIVESSFKAFARALRNLLDGVDTESFSAQLIKMYGVSSKNFKDSVALQREATIARQTKETSITTALKLDGGAMGVDIQTGVTMLDRFLRELALTASISLHIACHGDLWIDEHHTAEDVAIALGQVLNEALGTKAGLNRMWCATSAMDNIKIQVTMDLSNRPCFTHNLQSLETSEYIGDLTTEMFEHVLDSIVVNARMTVHIVEDGTFNNNDEEGADLGDNEEDAALPKTLENTVLATARAFGQALKYCSMIDDRRAGGTASSKGTLSA